MTDVMYSIEAADNGFLIRYSWQDENDKYRCKMTIFSEWEDVLQYIANNPLQITL